MNRARERVLVLGATGHLGQAIVRHWLERGHDVTAATRQADAPALRGLAVRTVRVDDRLSSLCELAAGRDLIVDAAAPHPLDPCLPGTRARGEAVALAARHAEQVIEAARACKVRLAFVSSCTTLAPPAWPAFAAESAWLRWAYPYFEVKDVMEQQVIAASRLGLPLVVANPGACLGPWEYREEGSSFVRLVLAGRLPAVIDRAINVIDVRDVAAAIDLALAHECFGRPIPLAGHNVTVAELAARIAAIGGVPAAPPLAIDSRLASAAAFWTQSAFAAAGRPAPDLWRAVPLIAGSFPMSRSLEQSILGLAIRPLDETLRDAVAFHIAVGSRGPM